MQSNTGKRAYVELDGELRYAIKVLAAMKQKSSKKLVAEALIVAYPELKAIQENRNAVD